VGGHEHHGVFCQVFNHVEHALVIASVSVFDVVPNRRFVSVILGKVSLFVHVSTSDQLDAQVVPENLGGGYFHLDEVCGFFKIALVSI